MHLKVVRHIHTGINTLHVSMKSTFLQDLQEGRCSDCSESSFEAVKKMGSEQLNSKQPQMDEPQPSAVKKC